MESSESKSDRPKAAFRCRTAWAVVTGTLLAASVAVTPNGADPDLWGHVQYGQDALREGLARTTTYSYTAEGYRWINHENLSELALAAGVSTIGPAGLLVLKALLGLAICAVPFWITKDFAKSPLPVVALSLLVALNLTNHWNVRPQLFSFGYFALLLMLLDYTFRDWQGKWNLPWLQQVARADRSDDLSWCHRRMRWLWLCVPLFCLWTNTHGGFAAGLAVFAAYLLCRMFEAAASRGSASTGMLRRLALMTFVATIATLLNPYSYGLHLWMFQALGVPRPEITEWHPLYSLDMFSLAFVALLAAIAASLIFSKKSLDFTHLVIILLVAGQALLHQRHVPFLAMLAAFWVTPHAVSAWQRLVASRQAEKEPPPAVVWSFLILCGILLAVPLWHRVSVMPVYRDTYPVSALEFMDANRLHGRTVVSYNWAQYFIAARCGAGESTVQFDGRFRTCYPQSVVDRHFDFILGDALGMRWRGTNGPVVPLAVLEDGRPELVLLDRGQPHSEKTMRTAQGWSLLYSDALAQIWGRSSTYDDPQSPQYLPPQRRHVSDVPQTGYVAWPAVPGDSDTHTPSSQLARAQGTASP